MDTDPFPQLSSPATSLPQLSSSVTSSSNYSPRTDPSIIHIDPDIFQSPSLRRPMYPQMTKQRTECDLPSSSPPSSPPSSSPPRAPGLCLPSPRQRTLEARMRMHRKFQPYQLPGAPPLELRFAMRSVGRSSYSAVTGPEDAIAGERLFKEGLSHMSNNTVAKAYTARLAFKKCILARIAVAQAEIDALEKQRDFIQSVDQDMHGALGPVEGEITSLQEIMDDRSIADDISYHHAVYADELIALTAADIQLHQLSTGMSISVEGQATGGSKDSAGSPSVLSSGIGESDGSIGDDDDVDKGNDESE